MNANLNAFLMLKVLKVHIIRREYASYEVSTNYRCFFCVANHIDQILWLDELLQATEIVDSSFQHVLLLKFHMNDYMLNNFMS